MPAAHAGHERDRRQRAAATMPGHSRLSSGVAITDRSAGSASLPRLLTSSDTLEEKLPADTPAAPR